MKADPSTAFFWPPGAASQPLAHRDVGALQLLRHASAPGAVHGRRPSTPVKFAIGLLLMGLSFAVLVPATRIASTERSPSATARQPDPSHRLMTYSPPARARSRRVPFTTRSLRRRAGPRRARRGRGLAPAGRHCSGRRRQRSSGPAAAPTIRSTASYRIVTRSLHRYRCPTDSTRARTLRPPGPRGHSTTALTFVLRRPSRRPVSQHRPAGDPRQVVVSLQSLHADEVRQRQPERKVTVTRDALVYARSPG
jgi:hypothetical protein